MVHLRKVRNRLRKQAGCRPSLNDPNQCQLILVDPHFLPKVALEPEALRRSRLNSWQSASISLARFDLFIQPLGRFL